MCNEKTTLNLKICSDISNVCCTTKQVVSYLKDYFVNVNPDIFYEIKVILNELILNAVRHGNRGVETKCVMLEVEIINGDSIAIRVEDEGAGFNYLDYLKEGNETDNSKCECFNLDEMKECGRGLRIVRSLCDYIQFNETGSCIKIIKKVY